MTQSSAPTDSEGAAGVPPADSEWLDVDGTSGYACGTVGGAPGRRYHGWLVVAPAGSTRRHHFLARAVERVRVSGDELRALGAQDLLRFAMRPWPRWEFAVGDGIRLIRELVRVHGQPTVLWRYRVAGGTVELHVEPRLTCRDADHLHFANDSARTVAEPAGRDRLRFAPYDGLPPVTLVWAGGKAEWRSEPEWQRGIELAMDLRRGYDGHEDHLAPGHWNATLEPGRPVGFGASIGEVGDPLKGFDAEQGRRERVGQGDRPTDWRARMDRSADDFLYRDANGRLGVLAGMPWFGEWGRDTFLSLPGLTLARGRRDLCAEVLTGALPYLRDGLLPNIFGADQDDSHYGSVDASMWYARAVQLYDRDGGDQDLVLDTLAGALEQIAVAYRDGTGPVAQKMGVRADDAMLLEGGSVDLNATWMDANAAGVPVTPRHGCAVEMNGLWYQLLAYLAELAGRRRDDRARREWQGLRDLAGRSFLARFWLAEGYLADVWRGGVADRAIRPNMVLAAAQELSPLSAGQRRAVVATSRQHLLTPHGLRTLAPSDPAYRGRYEGGLVGRDQAYHQGTVWPWLLGAHVEAAWRVGPRNSGMAAELTALWQGMMTELDQAGLEHLSEVFDGDPPRRPGGTFAQAWNTAECLRSVALVEGDLAAGGGIR